MVLNLGNNIILVGGIYLYDNRPARSWFELKLVYFFVILTSFGVLFVKLALFISTTCIRSYQKSIDFWSYEVYLMDI